MKITFFIIFLFIGLFSARIVFGQSPSTKIKHVIVLMLENRSFDHMLGLMMADDPSIEGCLPSMGKQCSNPLDPHAPSSSPWYPVTDQAVENCTGGPDQSFAATTDQLYGFPSPQENLTATLPNMTGFIAAYSLKQEIMANWPPYKVPAITTLAREFAVMNRYYGSVPGQTVPNRLYFFSATSHGAVDDNDAAVAAGYPQRTVFENIDQSKFNQTWSVYFTDEPSAFYLTYPRLHPDKIHLIDQFYTDVAAGNIANFVFLDPRYNNDDEAGLMAEDQEAPHNVGMGDRLIKKVYEAIRASPVWESTLFIVTYEHGGFFDHVPPPADCPNPDGINSKPQGFTFDRLGVRLPTVLVSPWITRGLRIGEPEGGAHYEHSSFSATIINLFIPDMPFLTKRDAWAPPYDWVVDTESSPRQDCIRILPEAPITDI